MTNIHESGISRKKLIVGVGIGLAATALAACTTYGKKPATAPATTDGVGGADASPAGPANAIAQTSDVPVGSGVIVDDVVLTQPTAGEYQGFSAVCTHAGCSVSTVAGGTINCPCHGSKFNLDGSVASGPASNPLEARSIAVQGNSIILG